MYHMWAYAYNKERDKSCQKEFVTPSKVPVIYCLCACNKGHLQEISDQFGSACCTAMIRFGTLFPIHAPFLIECCYFHNFPTTTKSCCHFWMVITFRVLLLSEFVKNLAVYHYFRRLASFKGSLLLELYNSS